MAKDDLYTQVTIVTAPELREEFGTYRDVRWIPKKFAKVGKRIKFDKDTCMVFVVEATYSTVSAEAVDAMRHQFHRFETVLDKPRKK